MAFQGNNPKANTRTYTPQSADPTNTVEGMVFRSDGTVRAKGLWEFINGAFVLIASEPGDADTIDLIIVEVLTGTSDLDLQGNNTDFDGGGTITASSLSLSTTAADLIKSDSVIKYDPDADGSDDYFGFTRDIPKGLRGRELAFSFEYKNDSTTVDDDFRFAVKIKDGVNAGNIEYFDMPAFNTSNDNSTNFSVGSFISGDCTQVEFGWQSQTTTTTVELLVDNILISTNPFIFKNLIEKQELTYDQNVSDIVTTSGIEFNLSNIVTSGSSLLTPSNVSSQTIFTANQPCTVHYHFSADQNNLNGWWELELNGTVVQRGNAPGIADRRALIAGTIILEADDFIAIGTSATTAIEDPSANVTLSITTEAQAEHVITPAKSNLTDWTAFTPTAAGFGTITGAAGRYRQVGDTLEIEGRFAAGSPVASTASVDLPSGFTIDTAKISDANENIMGATVVTSSTNAFYLNSGLADAIFSDKTDTNSVFFSTRGSADGVMAKANGNQVAMNASDGISFRYSIPIVEGSSDVSFLAAIPVLRTVHINTHATNYRNPVTGTVSYKTVNLDSITGDTSILSIATDQATLSKGKYKAYVPVGSQNGSDNVDLLLFDITNAANIEEFLDVCDSGVDSISDSTVVITFTLTTTTIIEFRTRAETAAGFETVGRITIDKIK